MCILKYNDMIDEEYLNDNDKKKFTKFSILKNIRDLYYLHNESVEEICKQYPKISQKDIQSVIDYSILPWYNPEKFILFAFSFDDYRDEENEIRRKENKAETFAKQNHFLSETYEYDQYINIRDRCYDVNSTSYKNYGGRGITMCDEWIDSNNYAGLKRFCEHFKPLNDAFREKYPNVKPTIDRIDNNKGYSPENCRVVSITEQARNTSTNVFNYETVSMIRYENEYLDFFAWHSKNRHVSNKSNISQILLNSIWEGIEPCNSLEQYIQFFKNNINKLDYESVCDMEIKAIRSVLIRNFKLINDKYITNENLGKLFNIEKRSLSSIISFKSYAVCDYNVKSYDEYILLLSMIHKHIDISKFEDNVQNDINDMIIVRKCRNLHELHGMTLEEIFNKYPKIPKGLIDDIINYKIFQWYKPEVFIVKSYSFGFSY